VNRFKLLLLLALSLNFIPQTSAHAEESGQTVPPAQSSETSPVKEPVKSEPFFRQYVGINGGGFIPNNDGSNSNLGLKNFGTGYDAGIFVGSRFNRYFALEAELDVYGANSKNPVLSGSESSTGEITVLATSLSAMGTLPLDYFQLFAGIGGNYYSDHMKNSTTSFGNTTISKATTRAFGYQLLSGVDINLSKRFALRVGYKYVVNKPEFNFVNIGKRTVNFGGSIVNGGIIFRYN